MKSDTYNKKILHRHLRLLLANKKFNLDYIQSLIISEKNKAQSLAHNQRAISAITNLLKFI